MRAAGLLQLLVLPLYANTYAVFRPHDTVQRRHQVEGQRALGARVGLEFVSGQGHGRSARHAVSLSVASPSWPRCQQYFVQLPPGLHAA